MQHLLTPHNTLYSCIQLGTVPWNSTLYQPSVRAYGHVSVDVLSQDECTLQLPVASPTREL